MHSASRSLCASTREEEPLIAEGSQTMRCKGGMEKHEKKKMKNWVHPQKEGGKPERENFKQIQLLEVKC